MAGVSKRRATRHGPSILAVLALAVVLTPLAPTGASELPGDPSGDVDDSVRVSDRRLNVSMDLNSSHYLEVNSAAGLAYYLTDRKTDRGGFTSLTAVDTESGETAVQRVLTNAGYTTLAASGYGSGYDDVMAVDEEGQRLFVATTVPGNFFAPGQQVSPTAGWACLGLGQVGLACLSGFSVLDATTLEEVRHVPLRSVQVDAPLLAPQLLGMSYSPAFEGLAPKVYLLIQDSVYSSYRADSAGGARYNARNYHNVTYLAQLDPETGQQDWVLRLDACRGAPSGSSGKENAQYSNSPHHAAVFRSRALGVRAVYVGCHTAVQSYTGGVVRVLLDEEGMAEGTGLPEAPAAPEQDVGGPGAAEPTEAPSMDRPFTVDGPDRVTEILADPESGRLAFQVRDGRPAAMVWYVFDTSVMQFIGTVGIGGPVTHESVLSTVSADGRLYTFAAPQTVRGHSFEGGLFVADIRQTPVPQALLFADLADVYPPDTPSDIYYRYALSPQALPGGGTRLWMPAELDASGRDQFIAIEDHRPLLEPVPVDAVGRTLDLDEVPGFTESVYDGVARGYGFRAVLVSGAEAAMRAGPVDPVGLAAQCNDDSWDSGGTAGDPFDTTAGQFDYVMDNVDGTVRNRSIDKQGPCYRADLLLPTHCADASREAVFAFVGPQGPAVVDGSGARGAAEPVYVDTLTSTDASAPASRCTGEDWDALWSTALFGRAPVGEPSGSEQVDKFRLLAECLSSSGNSTEEKGDPVSRGFSAAVSCDETDASGHAYARGVGIEGVTVAEALSSFRVYRDPARGIVSRVESVARGIGIDGLIRIDTVRGTAESWANGRQFVPSNPEDPSYDPNCDRARTAGTCFQRQMFGVWSPGYRCGPCGDEQAFVDGLNALLNPGSSLRLRDPDASLRIGSANGFTAAIQKPEHERFADLVLNTDLMQTTLPTLEVIRNAPPNRPGSRSGARGRQIYQFAGVEVSSSYGISCLLVHDEAANTCAGETQLPGSIQVSLSDSDGKPLAGGAFEVRQDIDADGVLGLKDTLLPDGACATAEDGVGTCVFDNLQPGAYLVSQVAAPPGYAKSSEPWVSEVASGEARTVAFTNVSNVSTIDVKATDENGAPISGATFAAYPDPDSDGKVAPDAKPAAECTTDAQGACQMKVPAGSYVLVQTGAPGGLEGIAPVPFTFASGGQVASVSVVNYPPAAPEQPQGSASPDYTPPVDQAPPREFVDPYVAPPVADAPLVDAPVVVSVPDRIGGTVTQVIRAPGDALRLLARDPKQAVAWTAALALFVLAALAVRRRQQAIELIRQ